MRVVGLRELTASKHEEGGASNEFKREPSELAFVFLEPGVVRTGHNGEMVAVSARHHEHSLSKSFVRFSHCEQSLRLLVEILEFSTRDWFEHFI